MANFAYLRVSTDEQDEKNQQHGLLEFANKKGFSEVEFVTDVVTGKKDWKDRELGKLIDRLDEGDNLIFAEISRMARSTLQVLEILKLCSEKKINVYIAKENMTLDDSMQAKIMATVFGLVAEIEREFISVRTKEALALRKSQGVQLGRPFGKQKVLRLDKHRKNIEDYVNKGLSISAIAKLVDTPRSTVADYIRARDLRKSSEKVDNTK